MANILKAISFFAGAGGCSLGFKEAGIDIISAYENNPAALDTYNSNFGVGICRNVDLSECDFTKIRDDLGLKHGELDLIIGGPPCQGFTSAGNKFWDDPRNKLVRSYAQALDVFHPRWFMMENVEGILTTASGSYIFEYIKKMIDIGYSVYLKKVYMQEYGIPQRRKRVIIVGNREGKDFSFPREKEYAFGTIFRTSSSTLKDAIQDLENVEIPEIDHTLRKESDIRIMRISALKVGQSMKDLPRELQNDSFRRRSHRRVCDGTPTEKRGGPPSGLKRLSYEEPCLTITSASTAEFVHPILDRTLTIRECARIQTFPDNFVFTGTDAQKIQQIGNAIPPKFARQIAERIIQCDKNAKGRNSASLVSFHVTKSVAMSPALSRTCCLLKKLMRQQGIQLSLGL